MTIIIYEHLHFRLRDIHIGAARRFAGLVDSSARIFTSVRLDCLFDHETIDRTFLLKLYPLTLLKNLKKNHEFYKSICIPPLAMLL